MDKINNSASVVEKVVNVGEKVVNFFSKHSVWQIFKSVILTVVLGYVIYFALNPQIIFEKYNEWQNQQHTECIEQRLKATKQVGLEMEKLLVDTEGERVFFIEFHNGNRSLEGNPFAFGQMSYEEVKGNTYYISDEFNDFSLTKYRTVNYIYENLYFYGTIEELAQVDKRLAQKLQTDNIKHIALIQVEGVDLPLGILGVTWNTEPMLEQRTIKNYIRQCSLRMSILLNI